MTTFTGDVVVVGGGIGGMAAALALSLKGFDVQLFEKHSTFGEVGAGMQIAPNCTRILDHWGVLDEIKTAGVLPSGMKMFDAMDGHLITQLDLRDMEQRYGYPYMVIHRSDLHRILMEAAVRAGATLHHSSDCIRYENIGDGARAVFANGDAAEAPIVIAADGMHSVARAMMSDDQPVNSAYVAYRGAMPIGEVADHTVFPEDVVVYVGPGRHFVQYSLRGGEMFNQVAVFESPKALADEEDWGTPDELDAAFEGSCQAIQQGLPLMWRDRWWRMFDREPLMDWVDGRIALLGDSAHPPLQYIAQGAIMAIQDAYVLAEHAATNRRAGGSIDADTVLAAYNAVRPEHCRRVLTTSRRWGDLWHLREPEASFRNALLEARDTYDYSFTDWLYKDTALTPHEEPELFTPLSIHDDPATAWQGR